jgi:hypothetical protein
MRNTWHRGAALGRGVGRSGVAMRNTWHRGRGRPLPSMRRLAAFLLLLCWPSIAPVAAAADAVDAPEEGWPDVDGTFPVAAGAAVQIVGAVAVLRSPEAPAVPLAVAAVQPPARSGDGRRFVLAHRPEGAFCTVLDAWSIDGDRWTGPRRLESEGCPDRVAIDPAGDRVAYASGRTGIAALYLVDFVGGAPRQLTNVGLEDRPPTPGAAPEGFVPPPHLGPPRFDGDALLWTAPDGEHRVVLP